MMFPFPQVWIFVSSPLEGFFLGSQILRRIRPSSPSAHLPGSTVNPLWLHLASKLGHDPRCLFDGNSMTTPGAVFFCKQRSFFLVR